MSSCGVFCAAYISTPPQNPLLSLPEKKFPLYELETNSFSSGVSEWKLIHFYYEIGASIFERKTYANGTAVLDAFSKDLPQDFSDIGGFSPKNLHYCRAFFHFYCDSSNWQQTVVKLADTFRCIVHRGRN